MKKQILVGLVTIALGASTMYAGHKGGFSGSSTSTLSETTGLTFSSRGHHRGPNHEIFQILQSDEIALTDTQIDSIDTILSSARDSKDALRDALTYADKYSAFSDTAFDADAFVSSKLADMEAVLVIDANSTKEIIALLTDAQKEIFFSAIAALKASE